jgi:heat shock protein 5
MIKADYQRKKSNVIYIDSFIFERSYRLRLEMLKDAEEFAEQDKLAKEKIDSKNSLESYIYSMKNSVEDPEKLANKLEDSEKKAIKEALKETQEWLDKNQSADKEAFESQLKDLQA